MADNDIALMAHLMRRAGFSGTHEELKARAAKGYEATVEELLNPEEQPDMEYDILLRYNSSLQEMTNLEDNQAEWVYRMVNSKRPLEEKMVLFWHSVLCAGYAKCEHARQMQIQLSMYVPSKRDGGVSRTPPGPIQRPGHGLLPGQLHEP